MKVIDKRVTDDEVWLKVKLDRSTDILADELFTWNEVMFYQEKAIKDFLEWQHTNYKIAIDNPNTTN